MEKDDTKEFAKRIRDMVRQLFKASLQPMVIATLSSRMEALTPLIQQATDAVAAQIMDEAKLEAAADAARKGAAFISIQAAINGTIEEYMHTIGPILNDMTRVVHDAFQDGVRDAVSDGVYERLREMLNENG